MKKLILIPFFFMCSDISARLIVIEFDLAPMARDGGVENMRVREERNPNNVAEYLRERIQEDEARLAQPNVDERDMNIRIARAALPVLRAMLAQEEQREINERAQMEENQRAAEDQKMWDAGVREKMPRPARIKEYKKKIY